MKKIDVQHLDYEEVLRGSKAFVKKEKRDSIYKVAAIWLKKYWYRPGEVVDGIGLLLMVWNHAFYRYDNFSLDFDGLEQFLKKNETVVREFHNRDISTLTKDDEIKVKQLFDDLLEVLRCKEKKSPVAVGKALHLLAPDFFPLWDNKISHAYSCHWGNSEYGSQKYCLFMQKMKSLSERIIQSYADRNNVDFETSKKAVCQEAPNNLPFAKSLLKTIDEYNYAFVKEWI